MSQESKIGLFAGSFDPLTKGHLNLIERSSKLFDELVILISINTTKNTLFSSDERVSLVSEAIKHLDNVRVDVLTDGLVATYVQQNNISAMVRGVRNTTDYEYEYGIHSANKKQYTDLETVVLFASDQYRYLSSSLIKEIAYFDGDISDMVPPHIEKALIEKMKNN